MTDSSSDQIALAALFAALVEALDEQSKGVAPSFARHLEAIQRRLAEGDVAPGVLETLTRTRLLLREDIDRSEPAYVIYAKRLAGTEDLIPSTDKIPLPTLDEAVQFWSRLPTFDRELASVETASGHRFDPNAVAGLLKRFKDHPLAAGAAGVERAHSR